MDDGIPTSTLTSAGMPHLHGQPNELDSEPMTAPRSQPLRNPVHSIINEGKAQLTSAVDGLVSAAHDIAERLHDGGAAPVADYVRKAAETVAIWSRSVDDKSLDEIADDTRAFVRGNPMLSVAIAVTGGFVLSRYLRASAPASTRR